MNYYLDKVEKVFSTFNTKKEGISLREAEKRLEENGKNELIKAKKKGLVRRFIEQLINPMVLVLLVAATISLVIAIVEKGGIHEYAEAGIIFAVVIINSILGVFQESKAEKAIDALQEMSAAVAKVRRDGVVTQIPASELVTGDIVLLEAGDAVPADLRLIGSASLQIEEAALTGESVPVSKITDAISAGDAGSIPLGDRKNMAYMGSSVTYGRGEGVVIATGMDTEMGKIADIIQSTQEGETPLQKRLTKLSKILSAIVLVICAIVFVIQIVELGKIDAEGILSSFMLAIALAVAAIPEGLAAVVTIVLSIGVTNMAKKNAIIRRLPAVETLGCAQVICSDKTGTLTQNKMTVVDNFGDDDMLAQSMFFCNDVETGKEGELVGDPTQLAQKEFGLRFGPFDEKTRVGEIPFDSERKMMTTIHSLKGESVIQYTTGAPDEILRNCSSIKIDGKIQPLTDKLRKRVIDENKKMADKALRVLGGAYKEYNKCPDKIVSSSVEVEMIFIGLIGMIDPVRPEVKVAVEGCKKSGIKVIMITGDHRDTAVAIGRELGIINNSEQAITGRELDELTDEAFEKCVGNIFVYARVQPEHKVRIVNMWRKMGLVTAMTGDGVNDAPAIKSGDIGIGMGITGTDVTKNVADMVLADDNFATIVAAVAEGRRIYDNIRKTLQFLLSTNLSEVISILVATLMGFTLFKPVHLLFINLITDTVPAVALGMEHADPDVMKRSPRGSNEGIFSDNLGTNILYQGLLITVLTLLSYFIVDSWHGTEVAMTSAFFTLSMCELFQAFTMRSLKYSIFTLKTHNKVLWGALIFSFIATLTVIYVPFLADIFSLQPLSFKEFSVSIGLAVLIIPIIEIVKVLQLKLEKK